MGSTNIQLLTAKQAANYLKVSVRSIYRLIDEGQIPYYSPTPKAKRIDKSDLFDYLYSRKSE